MKSIGVVVVVVVAAVGTGLFLSRKPWIDYREQKSLANDAKLDMQKAESDRAGYVRQTAKAESRAGREAIARERGYRRPNETPIDELK